MSEPTFEASEPVGEPITPSLRSAVARKQNFNIYTVMLIISFVCLLIGTLLLFFELRQYGDFPSEWPWKVTEGRPRTVLEILDRFRV
jgi:hypothetical protein